MVLALPANSSWLELMKPCQFATLSSLSGGSLLFGARDNTSCSILLTSYEGAQTAITVGSGLTQSSVRTVSWSCFCNGSCSNSTKVNVSLCAVGFNPYQIPSLDYENLTSGSSQPNMPPVHHRNPIWPFLLAAIVASVVLIIIFLVIKTAIRICKKRSK